MRRCRIAVTCATSSSRMSGGGSVFDRRMGQFSIAARSRQPAGVADRAAGARVQVGARAT